MTDMRVVDFRPAPAGWVVEFFNTVGPGTFTKALVGWLILEPSDSELRTYRDRDVVAAVMDGPNVCEVGDEINFWRILGPGDTPDSESEEDGRERVSREQAERHALNARQG